MTSLNTSHLETDHRLAIPQRSTLLAESGENDWGRSVGYVRRTFKSRDKFKLWRPRWCARLRLRTVPPRDPESRCRSSGISASGLSILKIGAA